MRLRPYQPADLPTLRAITIDGFTGVSIDHGIEQAFGPINGHDWQWRKARHIDVDVARDPAGCFVAIDESDAAVEGGGGPRSSPQPGVSQPTGQIAGYITTWQDPAAGLGHIPNLAVHPAYRNHGLGRTLIEHALAHFRACGLTHAKIETLAQNAIGNHLYPSLGFVEVARQVHFVAKL